MSTVLKIFTPDQMDTVRVEHLLTVLDCRIAIAKSPEDSVDTGRSAEWLRRFLAEFAGTRPQDVVLQTSPEGKPFWPGRDLHFNLSHSGPYWALALRRASPVGIDIETWRERARLSKIAARFFTMDENDRLLKTFGEDEFVRLALGIWTKKEAVAKLRGTGILPELAAARNVDLDPAIELWSHAQNSDFVISLAVDKKN